jgi:hypothetical protein
MPDLSRLRSDVGAFVDAIDWPLTRPVFLEPLGFHPAKRLRKFAENFGFFRAVYSDDARGRKPA